MLRSLEGVLNNKIRRLLCRFNLIINIVSLNSD